MAKYDHVDHDHRHPLELIKQANAHSSSGTLLTYCFPPPSASSQSSFRLRVPKSGQTFNLKHYRGNHLPPDLSSSILSDVRSSLRKLYDQSLMQWNESEKYNELTHPSHQLVIASSDDIPCAAFVCFRFDTNDDDDDGEEEEEKEKELDESEEGGGDETNKQLSAVTYVYEVFTHPDARGLGIASSLMKLIESISFSFSIPTVMLTVFDQNTAAVNLYTRHFNYSNDPSCPTRWGVYDAGYQILSKSLEQYPPPPSSSVITSSSSA